MINKGDKFDKNLNRFLVGVFVLIILGALVFLFMPHETITVTEIPAKQLPGIIQP